MMKDLGENLRLIRLQKKMTLQELSRISKVSKSQLSQIERNASVPTVAKLQKIAEALDINLSSLLPENGDSSSSSDAYPANHYKEDVQHPRVVRKGERRKIIMPDGPRVEMLCPDLQHRIEFIYLHYPVGTKVEDHYSHEGEECGVVLEGTFKGTFGAMEIILEPGDSIYYASTIPHCWETVGDTDVRAIWAITPPSF